MKIFDCFCFYNETELIELRFMELYDTVDHFVVVEANKTHTGKPKDFNFEKNKKVYQDYLDKVIYIKVEDCPTYDPSDPYKIEHFQRNAINRGLKNAARDGDKILVSDLDEIPKPEALKDCLDNHEWIFFQQDLYYYYVNCQVSKSCGGTAMAPYGTFRNPRELRRFAKRRYNYDPNKHKEVYPNGGWHYSYLCGGDIDRILEKVKSISEYDGLKERIGERQDVLEKVKHHRDLFGRTEWRQEQKIVDISKTKPASMDKFLEKYPHFYYSDKHQTH